MQKNTKKINRKNSGYLLVEVIFYILLFAILSVVVIDSLLVMTRSFKEVGIDAELSQGTTMMERITREIRQASSIRTISASDLSLHSTDSSGTAKTIEFLLSGTDLHILENNTLTGNLNTSNVGVTSASFTQITTAEGTAVKIVLTITAADDSSAQSESFYDTVVLRGEYAS